MGELKNQFYTIKEFMAETGLGKSTVYKMLKDGELRGRVMKGRTIIPLVDVQRWMNALPHYEYAPRNAASDKTDE